MKEVLLGNQAFARGAYEAGVTVAAAYPGTPSTEILENLADYDGVYVEWAPNEKVALEVAVGAAVAGGRALCCMKHVGLNVAADPLFTASYTGINAGLVIVVADDPGMHSSQNEQDSRFYARSAHIPMLEPADSMEAKDFIKIAFDLSEAYDTPVLVRSNTRISHSRGVVQLGDKVPFQLKEYKKDITKYVMMPGMARGRHVVVEQRMNRLASACNRLEINTVEMADRSVGVVTLGACYQYVKEALPSASVLKLGMVYPLPMDLIADFAAKVDKLYVVEELEPFVENQLKARGIPAVGKELFTVQGEYNVNMIKEAIAGEKVKTVQTSAVGRPPVLCPGCPHRAVFHTLRKLNLTVFGDIGCYTLGAQPPLDAMDTVVCMGASIGMTLGAEKARGKAFAEQSVAVIGDSTFIHSGITGLIDVAYNRGACTVIIVDNSTTGMTGHQNHPATGRNIRGDAAPRLDLEKLVRAVGIEDVHVVDPFDMRGFEGTLKGCLTSGEPSVIIARRPCILLKGVEKHLPYKIDDCRDCGKCMQLGCPALLHTEKGVVVDSTLCTGCGLCAEVCPFDAITGEG